MNIVCFNSRSSLIDFGDLTNESKTRLPEDDEFDMFAQSRSSTFTDSRQCGATYDDNKEEVPSEASIASVMCAKGPYPVNTTAEEPSASLVSLFETSVTMT